MKNFTWVSLVCVLIMFSGCALFKGASTTYKDGYKFEEVYSVGIATSTYQYENVTKCTETIIVDDEGIEHRTTHEPCELPITAIGFKKDVSSPIGPAFLQAGSTAGSALVINDGLRNQNVGDVNNSSSSTSQSVSHSSSASQSAAGAISVGNGARINVSP